MKIKNYKPVNKGLLKSSFTVVIPEWADMEVDGCLFEKSDGAYWVNYASKMYTNKDGEQKSYNQVRWPKATVERLNKAIREKIKAEDVEYSTHFQEAKKPETTLVYSDDDIPF